MKYRISQILFGLLGGAVFGLSGCNSLESLLQELPSIVPTPSSTSRDRLAAQTTSTAQMEVLVREQINQIRQQQGLSPLKQNDQLAEVARRYSRRMAAENFFSHTSPAGDSMVQRVRSAGIFYVLLGENLFTCTRYPQPASTAVQGWMNSPGHRANILKAEYRETGIGVWKEGETYYFTQLFMRSLW